MVETVQQKRLRELTELVAQAREAAADMELQKRAWQAWNQSMASHVLGVTALVPGGSPAGAQIQVQPIPKPDHPVWTWIVRAGNILAIAAVGLTVLSLIETNRQYAASIEQLTATTVYDVAHEGRELFGLPSSNTPTGTAINYHFSVYYMQQKNLIEPELRPMLLLDLCEYVHSRTDFDETWARLGRFYPQAFQTAVVALRQLGQCTLDDIKKSASAISTLENPS